MIAGEDLRCGDFVRVDPETGKVVRCTADNFRDHFTALRGVKRDEAFDPFLTSRNLALVGPNYIGNTFYLSDTRG
jgi:hypothetical protein